MFASQAELIAEKASDAQKQSALQLLKKAAEIFDRCYELQSVQLAQQEQELAAVESASQSSGSEYNSQNAVVAEQWASIVEPISNDALIDTTVAQLEVFTSMCGLTPWLSASDLDQIRDTVTLMFDVHRIPFSANVMIRRTELFLAKSNFTAAFLDASFRYNRIDAHTYADKLAKAFAPVLEPGLETPQARCDYADTLLTFYTTLVTTRDETALSSNEMDSPNHLQWTLLASALSDLQRALALPNVQNLARIHMRRGDCELLRYRMGESPTPYKPAISNAATLLKNAATYYRGSAAAARVEGEAWEATVKEAVANALANGGRMEGLVLEGKEKVGLVLDEMRSEGLISEECYQSLNG